MLCANNKSEKLGFCLIELYKTFLLGSEFGYLYINKFSIEDISFSNITIQSILSAKYFLHNYTLVCERVEQMFCYYE